MSLLSKTLGIVAGLFVVSTIVLAILYGIERNKIKGYDQIQGK